jgi:predicted AlkP superfamily phosphohydrolase/phosphomutase
MRPVKDAHLIIAHTTLLIFAEHLFTLSEGQRQMNRWLWMETYIHDGLADTVCACEIITSQRK